jgi:hypothetical protein
MRKVNNAVCCVASSSPQQHNLHSIALNNNVQIYDNCRSTCMYVCIIPHSILVHVYTLYIYYTLEKNPNSGRSWPIFSSTHWSYTAWGARHLYTWEHKKMFWLQFILYNPRNKASIVWCKWHKWESHLPFIMHIHTTMIYTLPVFSEFFGAVFLQNLKESSLTVGYFNAFFETFPWVFFFRIAKHVLLLIL